MKKTIALFLTSALLMLFTTSCSAADNFTLAMQIGNPVMKINGTEKEIDEGRGTTPVIINDRTLVPIRTIIEEMGGAVHWEADTRNVIIALGDNIIILTIDSQTAFVNGDMKILDASPTVINERTMLPIRFVSENLGFDVDWNGGEQLITINRI